MFLYSVDLLHHLYLFISLLDTVWQHLVFQNIKLIVPQFSSRELVNSLKHSERGEEREKEENRNIEKQLTI